jgi:WW domain-binding protein 11
MEVEYESKRNQMIKFFESVKSAQEVTIDDIPLPSAAPTDPNMPTAGSSMPSFLSDHSIPQSILKRQTVSSKTIGPHRAPPGVPPGPPPVLSDLEDDLDDEEDSEGDEKDKSKRIRFSEDLQTGEKDADVNEFLKELEQMEKTVPNSDNNVSQTIQSIQSLPAAIASQPTPTAAASAPPSLNAVPPPLSLQTNLRPSGPPPPMMMFRPPVPPSGIRPGSQPQNIPGLMVGRPPISGPPPMSGPPPPMGPMRPGVPPHHRMINARPMMQPMRPMGPGFPSTAGPPMGGKRDDKKTHVVSDRATIEAKPQLRNLSADATRFTPVALRVKRDDKGVKRSVHKSGICRRFASDFVH